jgi:hypothetical protein
MEIAGTKKIAGKHFFLQSNQKKSQQLESFKLPISRRWWSEEEQPIPCKIVRE